VTPRESTDLLAVFRSGPSSRGGARAVSRPLGGERPRGAVVLSRRQAFLGTGVALLAVLFAFIAGTAVGRGRRAPSVESASPLARTAAPSWQIRSKSLPRISLGAENLEARAVKEFRARFPQLAPHLSVAPVEDAKGRPLPAEFRLVVRGFDDKRVADQWRFPLNAWSVDMFFPFEAARPEPVP
jgi:hypothetical protein